MHRYLRLAGGVLAIAALAVLTIVLVLIVRGEQAKPQPISPALQSPIATPTPAPPAPIPTLAPTPIERCAFRASAAPPAAGPSLDSYHFSEPQVVLTHTSAIGIAGWLPDGQRLLITRDIPGQARQYIETFDVRTHELLRYGERHSFGAKPLWLPTERGVAFTDVLPDNRIALRISRGENGPVEDVVNGLTSANVAASSDGRQLIFFPQEAKERPVTIDVAQARREALPFTLPLTPQEDLPAIGQIFGPDPYQTAWHPQGKQVAFYNDTGLYLADLANGHVCQVDLGRVIDGTVAKWLRWAFYAQWSPNGRYLAMLTTAGDLPVKFSDLTILDTVTGEMHSMHPEVYLAAGTYYVTDSAWAPDSRHLAVLGVVRRDEVGLEYQGLYLVDRMSGSFQRVFPDRNLGGAWGGSLAWSPNGLQLAVLCPKIVQKDPPTGEGGLCLTSISQ